MSFITDKQTTDDLNLLGKFKAHSIFSLFNRVQTAGGERLLDDMFRHPLTNAVAINERSTTFRYFQENDIPFPFSKDLFQEVENYLGLAANSSFPITLLSVSHQKLMKTLLRNERFNLLQSGLAATINMLNLFSEFLNGLQHYPHPEILDPLRLFFADQRLQWLPGARNARVLPLYQMARYHYLLLHVLRKEMERLLEMIYFFDVCVAVSRVARERSFSYAHALPKEENTFRAGALSHPGLTNAIANPVSFDENQNLLFLTGANMAGKSTFMKAFGIAVYMAHMGFPVAATDLFFSVRDGLFTSINVPDDLNMGYSHFYAEVLRVKKVAEEVSRGNSLVVIFDELFKGTNVKDAYDATLSVTEAFAAYTNCFFIISTHIIEVGAALQEKQATTRFAYLPTVMDGVIPRYTYQLKEGITNDRQGMMIVENEGILEMLHS